MVEIQDLVVIGGGAGGFAAAIRGAQLGGAVTVIEAADYGGNCTNRACIPIRCLTVAARLVGTARKATRFGIRVGEPQVDMTALHDRKDRIVQGLRLGAQELLSDAGVTLIQGRGTVVAPGIVEIHPRSFASSQEKAGGESRIRARNIIVATGSVPAQMPIDGVDLPGVITSEQAIELRDVPARVAILGSKPYDLELAQYLNTMGSEVILVEGGENLPPDADREISQRVCKALYDEGIKILRQTTVHAVRSIDGGRLAVDVGSDHGELAADVILAARRLPNSAGLGLRQLGVRMEHGAVRTDDRMRTNIPGIYAIGDVTVGPMWSHKAHAEGLVAAENAMGLDSTMDYDTLPRCVYTWPEVAWVGLTEAQAEASGIEVAVGRFPTAFNPYAMILDESAGMIKVIASAKYGKILGVHIVAPGAVDLINSVAVAMHSEATVRELMYFLPGHPSLGEALVDAALDTEGRSPHLPSS
jgi:dihydrolipoamide dehydrogenase